MNICSWAVAADLRSRQSIWVDCDSGPRRVDLDRIKRDHDDIVMESLKRLRCDQSHVRTRYYQVVWTYYAGVSHPHEMISGANRAIVLLADDSWRFGIGGEYKLDVGLFWVACELVQFEVEGNTVR